MADGVSDVNIEKGVHLSVVVELCVQNVIVVCLKHNNKEYRGVLLESDGGFYPFSLPSLFKSQSPATSVKSARKAELPCPSSKSGSSGSSVQVKNDSDGCKTPEVPATVQRYSYSCDPFLVTPLPERELTVVEMKPLAPRTKTIRDIRLRPRQTLCSNCKCAIHEGKKTRSNSSHINTNNQNQPKSSTTSMPESRLRPRVNGTTPISPLKTRPPKRKNGTQSPMVLLEDIRHKSMRLTAKERKNNGNGGAAENEPASVNKSNFESSVESLAHATNRSRTTRRSLLAETNINHEANVQSNGPSKEYLLSDAVSLKSTKKTKQLINEPSSRPSPAIKISIKGGAILKIPPRLPDSQTSLLDNSPELYKPSESDSSNNSQIHKKAKKSARKAKQKHKIINADNVNSAPLGEVQTVNKSLKKHKKKHRHRHQSPEPSQELKPFSAASNDPNPFIQVSNDESVCTQKSNDIVSLSTETDNMNPFSRETDAMNPIRRETNNSNLFNRKIDNRISYSIDMESANLFDREINGTNSFSRVTSAESLYSKDVNCANSFIREPDNVNSFIGDSTTAIINDYIENNNVPKAENGMSDIESELSPVDLSTSLRKSNTPPPQKKIKVGDFFIDVVDISDSDSENDMKRNNSFSVMDQQNHLNISVNREDLDNRPRLLYTWRQDQGLSRVGSDSTTTSTPLPHPPPPVVPTPIPQPADQSPRYLMKTSPSILPSNANSPHRRKNASPARVVNASPNVHFSTNSPLVKDYPLRNRTGSLSSQPTDLLMLAEHGGIVQVSEDSQSHSSGLESRFSDISGESGDDEHQFENMFPPCSGDSISQEEDEKDLSKPLMLKIQTQNVTECVIEEGREIRVGDIVWGKIQGFPWWPGRVSSITVTQRDNNVIINQLANVAWFGSNTMSHVHCSDLFPFLEDFKIRYNKKKKGPYKMAIKQATLAAQKVKMANDIDYRDILDFTD